MTRVLNESAVDECKICVSIVGTSAKLMNSSFLFGAVSMCKLRVQGRLCLASLTHDFCYGLIFPAKGLGFDRSRYKKQFGCERFDEGSALFDNEKIFCLEIATSTGDRSRRSRNGENAMIHGLILYFTGIQGQYHRVGDFNLDLNYLARVEPMGSFFFGCVPWVRNQEPSFESLRETLFTNTRIDKEYYKVKEGDKYTIAIM